MKQNVYYRNFERHERKLCNTSGIFAQKSRVKKNKFEKQDRNLDRKQGKQEEKKSLQSICIQSKGNRRKVQIVEQILVKL